MGYRDLAARWEAQYVRPTLHSVDDCSDCRTKRVRCDDAGTEGHSVEKCHWCWENKIRCKHAGSSKKGIPFDEIVRGGFYGIDVKQTDDGRFNVHMHILADCPFLPQAALASAWDDQIGAPNVDIRRIDERGEADEETALMEAIGYAAKAPEFENPADEAKYMTALKGVNLIQPFGNLHGNTPDAEVSLRCANCELEPEWWNYEGVVDGCRETVLVGSAPDGDRPPDN
jgi:hypothetical protein